MNTSAMATQLRTTRVTLSSSRKVQGASRLRSVQVRAGASTKWPAAFEYLTQNNVRNPAPSSPTRVTLSAAELPERSSRVPAGPAPPARDAVRRCIGDVPCRYTAHVHTSDTRVSSASNGAACISRGIGTRRLRRQRRGCPRRHGNWSARCLAPAVGNGAGRHVFPRGFSRKAGA